MNRFSWQKIAALFFPSVMFGLLATFLVFAVWQPYVDSARARELAQFELQHHTDTDKLQCAIDLYVQTLYSARGLFMASDSVSRSEWTTFFNTIGTTRQLPGLGLLAYIEQVPITKKDSFVTELNNDKFLQEKELSDVVIFPESSASLQQVVKYIEPQDLSMMKSLLGFNFSAEESRQHAFENARDLNTAITTSPLYSSSPYQNSFVIVLPLYDKNKPIITPAERRDAYFGLVAISMRMKDIFDKSFSSLAAQSRLVQVYDGVNTDEDHLIYQNMKVSTVAISNGMSTIESVTMADRTLTVKYTSLTPREGYTLINSIWGRVGILVVTNLLTAWYVWTQIRTSKR